MTLGRLAYLIFYRPLGAWKQMMKEGGPIEQWKTERGRRGMEQAAYGLTAPVTSDKWRVASEEEVKRDGKEAAWQLTSIRPRDQETKRPEEGQGAEDERQEVRGKGSDGKAVEVQVLTGRKFWYQTAFCLWSFAKASGREVRAVVHDDGSLDQRQAEVLLRLFPGSRMETCDMIKERLDALLPASKFPALRARRMELPLMKKILDVHAGRTGWTLFMDADLLFFRRPDFLLSWWDKPSQPLTSVDAEYAYGYPLELLEELAGDKVRPLINTGLSGHRSDLIDWDKMEYWCKSLVDRAGKHYYQEQALIALLTAGRDCAVLPPEDYVTLPREPEASRCEAVMHHYVASSKPWYFRTNWRRVMAINS